MGLQMEPFNHLQVIGQSYANGLGGIGGKEPVVIASPVAHAATTLVKDRAWCDDHIKQAGIKPLCLGKRWIRFRDAALPC